MLLFDPEDHSYSYQGLVLPSVTQCLSLLEDYSGIPAHILDRKARLGTAVHKACELYVLNDLDEDSLHPAVAPYFEQFKLWMRISQFKPNLTEKRVHSKRFRYAGTLDLHGEYQSCQALIDIKTAAAIMPTWGPQLAAYEAALEEETGIKTDKRYALQLGKDSHKLVPLTDKNDLNIFYSALTIKQWKIKHGKSAA